MKVLAKKSEAIGSVAVVDRNREDAMLSQIELVTRSERFDPRIARQVF